MTIGRLTLASEFYDMTSPKMLLPPEPQYFWANLLFAGMSAAELRKGAGAPFGTFAGRQVPTSGADVPDIMRLDANWGAPGIASEAIVVEDFQSQPGHTVRMNRMVFADTTYTETSRDVTRATIGTTGVDVSGEQVEMTIKRYAGPLIAAAGAVGPHIIEEFDAKRLPVHDLSARVSVHLRRDRMKFVDSVLATKYCTSASSARYAIPGDFSNALTTDNSAFVTQGDRPMDVETIIRAEQIAITNSIPTFSNGRYACVLSPIQYRQLRTSSQWNKQSVFDPTKNVLSSRYVGTISNTDVFVSSTNTTTTANSTITVQLGVLMGPGAVGYAMAMPCEVRPDDATNYGQRIAVVWMADEAFATLDNRFLVSLRSD